MIAERLGFDVELDEIAKPLSGHRLGIRAVRQRAAEKAESHGRETSTGRALD
ncbi:hypothetical protein D3C83_301680 [compost metagenome]